jgi:outer membrane protein insertion porin family
MSWHSRCVLISVFASFAGISSLAQSAPATDQPTAATYRGFEGNPVSRVDIAVRPSEDIQELQRLVRQKEGQPFSMQALTESVADLQHTGKFTKVQVSLEPEVSGLHVTFILQPVYNIGLVSFPGAANRFSYSRLLQAVNVPVTAPFVKARLADKEKGLQAFLADRGYFTAVITTTTQVDDQHRLVNISFECRLRDRAKVGDVTVQDGSAEETADLKRTLGSFRARLARKALRPGTKYSANQVNRALDNLRAHLQKQDRLSSKLHMERSYDAESNRVNLTLFANPGPKVSVKVLGAHVWGRTLKQLVPIFQEHAVDQGLIEEGKRNLISHFQRKSYFDVSIDAEMEKQDDQINVLYHVVRGKREKLSDIRFEGNQHFNGDQLAGHISLEKARFLNRGKFSQELLKKSTKSLSALYRNDGYPDVTVAPQVTRHGDNVEVVFQIDEGEQIKIRDLKIVNMNEEPMRPKVRPQSIRLAAGAVYSPFLLDRDRNRILAQYLNNGYPDATFDAAITPAGEPHTVDVLYKIDEGRQVHIADVVILGADHTRPQFIRDTVDPNVREGKPLSERDVLQSESDLYSLGIFDWANTAHVGVPDDATQEQLLIRLHESKRNSVDIGGGLEIIPRSANIPVGSVVVPGLPPVSLGKNFTVSQKSFVGPRGSLQYARKNIRGRAETATLALVGSRLDQRATLTYTDPDLHGSRWSSLFNLSSERTTQNPIYTAYIQQASFQVETYLDKKKTQRLVSGYSYQRTDLSNILIPELVLPQDQRVKVSSVYAQFVHDSRDKPLDAHKGVYETLSLSIAPTAFGSSSSFTRFVGQFAFYRPVKPWLLWANSFRVGLAAPFGDRGYVPLSERFFTGGPDSLRGFPINGAGPQRPVPVCSNPADTSTCTLISVPGGGLMLGIFNSEARFPIPLKKDLGGVVFYDGGNAYQNINAHQFVSNYTNSIGFGIRYNTRVGPVRFDVGRNLNPIPGIKATQYFVTLGQAF